MTGCPWSLRVEAHDIVAMMTRRDRLILRPIDRFDFWRRSRQVHGLPAAP